LNTWEALGVGCGAQSARLRMASQLCTQTLGIAYIYTSSEGQTAQLFVVFEEGYVIIDLLEPHHTQVSDSLAKSAQALQVC
jgi:hypothetical protein